MTTVDSAPSIPENVPSLTSVNVCATIRVVIAVSAVTMNAIITYGFSILSFSNSVLRLDSLDWARISSEVVYPPPLSIASMSILKCTSADHDFMFADRFSYILRRGTPHSSWLAKFFTTLWNFGSRSLSEA